MPAENVIVSGLPGRYATALFELAREADELDRVERDLAQLSELSQENAALAAFLKSPVLSRRAQGAAVAKIAESASLSPLVTKFLGVLAENRRLAVLAAIFRDFARLAADHRGEGRAMVRSAKPLDAAQMAALKERLKRIAGRDVTIDAEVDESLIGGLVVQIGSRMIDGSIATKLDTLERAMKGV